MGLRIQIVCPAPAGSRTGNRVTALRWARLLRDLGHAAQIRTAYTGQDVDLLMALHARRSAEAASRFCRQYPTRPLVVCLTGTDLYRDLAQSRRAQRCVASADRLIVLQRAARAQLPRALRRRARVIHQSVSSAARPPRRDFPVRGTFRICIVGHLRPVKDPFRTVLALRCLPASPRLRVRHLGRALTPRMRAVARAHEVLEPRYRWLGERSHCETLRFMARSHLLVHSSRMEGGANVIAEAAYLALPILASRIDGNIGLLGARHPGLFCAGSTSELADLLRRCESDAGLYRALITASRRIAPLFTPAQERSRLRTLLAELF
ncbi:MAG: selenoneine biosynthesis selenosugar synthase SenB [Myxococcota bacterium]